MRATSMTPARTVAALTLAGALTVSAAGPGHAATTPGARDERVLLTVTDPRITESSGLAVSLRHRGVLYTHNDSDDVPRFFAIGRDGRTRATFTLADASARDWEAMAAYRGDDGRAVLHLADIGDNLDGAWPSVSIYRVREPRVLRDATVPATEFRFRYADGARNAEALLVHPRTGRLYVASREWEGGLYAAPKKLSTDSVNVLRRVAHAPPFVTDGAFAPDGSRFVLQTYVSARIYRAPGQEVARISIPDQPQAESVAYTRNGRALLVGSEGRRSKIWRVPLSPDESGQTPTPTPAPRRTSQGPAGSLDDSGRFGALALVLAGVVAALVARRASRRDR
ncbi:MAG: hypothetical protein GEV03_19905 [Streptosporangiales bacterium]|nr:hypothetical protein [Streptosporangiales bacterium]